MVVSSSFIFILLLSFSSLWAEERPSLPADPPGLKVGMEIELGVHYLANLMMLFDFEAADKTHAETAAWIPEGEEYSILKDYIKNNRAALAELPEDVRAHLTDGLQLNSGLQLTRPNLILRESSGPTMQIPQTRYVNRNGVMVQGGVDYTAVPDWNTVNDRWNALPVDTQAQHLEWELLSPANKAYLMTTTLGRAVTLKADVDPSLKELFSQIDYGPDYEIMEFRHLEPFTSFKSYTENLMRFARLAGVERRVLNAPDVRRKGFSYHIHLSSDRNLAVETLQLLNKLLLVKRLSLGDKSDLEGLGFVYNRDIQIPGLLRQINSKHFEIRAHPFPYYETLEIAARVMTLPSGEANAYLRARIAELLTDEVVEFILKHGAARASFLYGHYTPAQKARVDVSIGANFPDMSSMKYWEVYTLGTSILKDMTPPPEFFEQLRRYLHKLTKHHRKFVMSMFDGWTPHFPDRISTARELRFIEAAVNMGFWWPERLDQEYSETLLRRDEIAHEFARLLSAQKKWKRSFERQVNRRLPSIDRETKASLGICSRRAT